MDTGRPNPGTFTRHGLALALLLLLAACGGGNDAGDGMPQADEPISYVVLDESLQALRDDFNANVGKVRMVFISGPTCAVCLRGLADLQRDLMSRISGDPRYVVFLVHVPTLGAEEEHVIQSLPLLHGPNVMQYWDEPGTIGLKYQEVMDTGFYLWDWWAIYDPDVMWKDELPPAPLYWEHQLGGALPEDLYLDTRRFTDKVLEAGSQLALVESEIDDRGATLKDGIRLDEIWQGMGITIAAYHNGRGGYDALKQIQRIESIGRVENADGDSLPLKVTRDRGHGYRRVVDGVAAYNDDTGIAQPQENRGLPAWVEKILLESYEFDGPITEWKDKGHQASKDGMETFAGRLNFVVRLSQRQGFEWQFLIDTHTGDPVSKRLLDDAGNIRLEIRELSHEDVEGYRFPTEIAYLDGAGQLLGKEFLEVRSLAVDRN